MSNCMHMFVVKAGSGGSTIRCNKCKLEDTVYMYRENFIDKAIKARKARLKAFKLKRLLEKGE